MKINIDQPAKARIEMLPLIDIVFLLLVFFIYAMLSMAVHRGVAVVLPTSTSAKIDQKLLLSVAVRADGSIYVDKDAVSLTDLQEVLVQKASTLHEPGVLLFADKNIPYQKLFQVLDRIRQAGLNRISLQAEVESEP